MNKLAFAHPRFVVAVVFLAVVLIAMGAPSLQRGRTDFLSFYAGGKLVGTPDLYSAGQANRIQREFADPREVRPFLRPPFYAAMLWPLAQFSYSEAALIWQVINLLALAGFLLLWKPQAWAAVACCLFLPTWLNFAAGQDVPVLLFLFAGSARLLEEDEDFLAGLVMALCSIEPLLLLPLPVLILAKGLWKFCMGVAGGLAGLTGVCYLVAARDWPARYLGALQTNAQFQDTGVHMSNLVGWALRAPQAHYWIAAGCILVAAGAWLVARRFSLQPAMGFTLFAALLLSQGGFLFDWMLALPLLLHIADYTGPGKAMMMTGLIGFSTLALAVPGAAFAAQVVMAALFLWVVYESGANQSFGKLRIAIHREI